MWRESEPPAVAGGLAPPRLGQTIDQPPATAGGSDSRHGKLKLGIPLDSPWVRLGRKRLEYARVPTPFVLNRCEENFTLCQVISPQYQSVPPKTAISGGNTDCP